ncbi:MFS transporter [Bailinhaonella thermotolerans]|uniref:MFS transporter n=1 Tax=Bailinhaonella thermotolerans TaxID=1070861 RepID=A0A3A4APA7_9ACTN|nr:MFS transporter [Bailinhaonella thermotolerans]RJL30389.1 MFS transporter [Bailinhaonella thermotolerans]
MIRPGPLPTLLAGAFVTTLDFFVVNVAVPEIQRDLSASAAAIEWTVAGYGLAFGAGLVLGGRLGDVHGRRRMLMLGLALFTLASLACGVAPDAGTLVAARIAQGVSAALLAPQVLAIMRTAFTGAALGRALRTYALTLGMAAVFGQLIGGLLIEADVLGLGWRAIFLVNLPIGVVTLALARRTVPESRADGVRLDLGGAALITAALTAVLLPLIEGREQGWPGWIWASFGAAVVLLAAYARRRHPSPLVDLTLFRSRSFTAGLVAQIAFNLGMGAYFLVFALYMQGGRGLGPLAEGLVFAPIGAGYLAASLAAPRLSARFGRQVIVAGGIVRAVSLAALAAAVATDAPFAVLVPLLALDGAGMGLALAPLMGAVLAGVPAHQAGAASGTLTTAQQIGNALGVGLIGVVFYGAASQGVPHAFVQSLLVLVAATLAVSALARLLPRPATPAPAPPLPAEL